MAARKGQVTLPAPVSIIVDFMANPSGDGILKVVSPFRRLDGYPFSIFMVKPKGSTNYVLSDGNSILFEAQGTNISLHPGMLRQLVNSYGLKLSETLMVFEDSDDPLDVRVLRFLQAVIAIEGILRMWGLNSRVRVDAPREGENSSAIKERNTEFGGSDAVPLDGRGWRPASASKASKPSRKTAGVCTPKR